MPVIFDVSYIFNASIIIVGRRGSKMQEMDIDRRIQKRGFYNDISIKITLGLTIDKKKEYRDLLYSNNLFQHRYP